MIERVGLPCAASTWWLGVLLTGLWLITPRLVLMRGGQDWSAAARSFLGIFWLGFGVAIVGRFWLLLHDAVTYGDNTYRLADLSPGIIDLTLGLAIAHWLAVVVGFSTRGAWRTTGGFGTLHHLGARRDLRPVQALIFGVCMVLSSGPFGVPLALVTALGIVGSLWIVPAAYAWAAHFASPDADRSNESATPARYLLLLPGLMHYALSPFRERLLAVVLVPLLGYFFARRRAPRGMLLLVLVAGPLLLKASAITTAYRDVLWGDQPLSSVMDAVWSDGSDDDDPGGQMVHVGRRFHTLDSLLLTVDLVPLVFPHSGRTVLTDGFVRGLVPRVLMPNKELSDRGPEFARTIWSYHSGDFSEAAIAPSMTGDLYAAGGSWYVVIGGLIWGALLGMCDGWSRRLPAGGAAAITIFYATQILPAVERDFAHAVASLLQSLVVIGVLGILAGTLAAWAFPQEVA